MKPAPTHAAVAQPAPPADPAAVVEQQVMLLLRRVRAGFKQLAREVHPELDTAAYGILHLIDLGEGTTVTSLAARLSVGKPTVSRQVGALEKLGLLVRAEGSTARVVELRLTAEGRVRLDTARDRRQEQLRLLLAEWSVQDVETLGALLTRFNQLSW